MKKVILLIILALFSKNILAHTHCKTIVEPLRAVSGGGFGGGGGGSWIFCSNIDSAKY